MAYELLSESKNLNKRGRWGGGGGRNNSGGGGGGGKIFEKKNKLGDAY